MLSKCNPHYSRCILKSPENPYDTKAMGGAAELRGYDGSSGSWLVFLVEINSAEPLTFRWSDDMARTWKATKVPVTFAWQPLSSGAETVPDISEGYDSCVSLREGTDVTVRNLRMVGHTGLGDGPGWHSFKTSSGKARWPVGLKPCSASRRCAFSRMPLWLPASQ